MQVLFTAGMWLQPLPSLCTPLPLDNVPVTNVFQMMSWACDQLQFRILSTDRRATQKTW